MLNVTGSLFWTIIILLVVYFGYIIWIGKKGKSHSSSMSGFATARGKVNPVIVGASFAASYASANLFIGVRGLLINMGHQCCGIHWDALVFHGSGCFYLPRRSGGTAKSSVVFPRCRNGLEEDITARHCKCLWLF